MEIPLFFKAFILGLSCAAPIGPIGLLCIRRSLRSGFLEGLAIGIGAAIADGIYGAIVAIGIQAIGSFVKKQQFMLYMLGGIFLICIGIKIFFSKLSIDTSKIKSKRFFATLIESTLLTITNPFTILTFFAIFTWIGLDDIQSSYSAVLAVSSGVSLGSLLWFTLLSLSVSLFRAKCTDALLTRINRISGILLISSGIISLLTLLTF